MSSSCPGDAIAGVALQLPRAIHPSPVTSLIWPWWPGGRILVLRRSSPEDSLLLGECTGVATTSIARTYLWLSSWTRSVRSAAAFEKAHGPWLGTRRR